jgi:small subunit ribosomal protein S1
VIEGPVTNITNFGAFVQLAEGVEGMIHVSEISAEKRINHPKDVLKVGQVVRAQVVAVDQERHQFRLSMKQLLPTTIDEYMSEHKPGDVVTGRTIDISGGQARVELGEGIQGICRIAAAAGASGETRAEGKPDLSSLSSMLKSRWKGTSGASKPEEVRAGQIRSFRIARLDAAAKKIELELVS